VASGECSARIATRSPSVCTAATTARRLTDSERAIRNSRSFSRGVPAAKIAIATHMDERARRVLEIGWVGHSPTEASALNRCLRSHCHRWRPSPTPTSCSPRDDRSQPTRCMRRAGRQGLAQLCVGITHAERGNLIGAMRLLGRARRRLEAYAASGAPVYGLDLGRILEWIHDREGEPDGSSWLADQPL